jgi:hypothetical protein
MIKEYIISSNGKEPLNSHYYSTNHPSIYAAAERIFGSWGNAISAAGLDYNAIRKYKVWNKMRIVQTIRRMHKEGEKLSSQHAQNHFKSLYMASVHHFKSWGKAIQAAGIDYSKIRMRRSMTEEQIKAEIIALYKSGVDLAYSNIRKNYQYLLAYGMKKLGQGSWAEARRACGIKENYRLPKEKRPALRQKKCWQPGLF